MLSEPVGIHIDDYSSAEEEERFYYDYKDDILANDCIIADSMEMREPSPRFRSLLTSDGDYIYVYAGRTVSPKYVWRYNLLTGRWRLLAGKGFRCHRMTINRNFGATQARCPDGSSACQFIEVNQYVKPGFEGDFNGLVARTFFDRSAGIWRRVIEQIVADKHKLLHYHAFYEYCVFYAVFDRTINQERPSTSNAGPNFKGSQKLYGFKPLTENEDDVDGLAIFEFTYDPVENVWRTDNLVPFTPFIKDANEPPASWRKGNEAYWRMQPPEIAQPLTTDNFDYSRKRAVSNITSIIIDKFHVLHYRNKFYFPDARYDNSSHWLMAFQHIIAFDLGTRQFSWIPLQPDEKSGFPPMRNTQITNAGRWAYIVGGYRYPFGYDDIWRLDLETFKWKKFEQRLPLPRQDHSLIILDEFLYVFGGYCNMGFNFNCLSDLTPDERSRWTEVMETYVQKDNFEGHCYDSGYSEKLPIFIRTLRKMTNDLTRIRLAPSSLQRICAEVVMATWPSRSAALRDAIDAFERLKSSEPNPDVLHFHLTKLPLVINSIYELMTM